MGIWLSECLSSRSPVAEVLRKHSITDSDAYEAQKSLLPYSDLCQIECYRVEHQTGITLDEQSALRLLPYFTAKLLDFRLDDVVSEPRLRSVLARNNLVFLKDLNQIKVHSLRDLAGMSTRLDLLFRKTLVSFLKSGSSGNGMSRVSTPTDVELQVGLALDGIRAYPDLFGEPLSNFGISVRLQNVLEVEGVYKLLDLPEVGDARKILRMPNLGAKTAREIYEIVFSRINKYLKIDDSFDERLSGLPKDHLFDLLKSKPDFHSLRFPIDVSTRLDNFLSRNSISTFGDLVRFGSTRRLLELRGLGRTILIEISEVVQRVFQADLQAMQDLLGTGVSDPRQRTTDVKKSKVLEETALASLKNQKFDNFRHALDSSFSQLRSSQVEVLALRSGRGLGSPLTLEACGEKLGVTRERVRQIEQRACRLLAKTEAMFQVQEHFQKVLDQGRVPLEAVALNVLNPWFPDVQSANELWEIEYVLAKICGLPHRLVLVDDTYYLMPFSKTKWDDYVASAKTIYSSLEKTNIDKVALRVMVGSLLSTEHQEYGDFLWASTSENLLFSDDDVYIGDGSSAEEYVEWVLSNSATPLHYSEIMERLKSLNIDADERHVSNIANDIGFLFSRGVYGLERHLPKFIRANRENIIKASESLVLGASSRQWSAREILAHCEDLEIVPRELLNDYTLTALLKSSGTRLAYLGRNVWSADRGTSKASRIDINEAVQSIIERAGRPMHQSEFRSILEAERGLSEHFQIHCRVPLVRVESGLWGLLGRDVDVFPEDVPVIEKLLIECLEREGIALHESRIVEKVGHTLDTDRLFSNLEVVKSLAGVSDFVSVAHGGYFYLKTWNDSRVPNALEILREILGVQSINSVPQISALLSERCGQNISRYRLYGMCKELGYKVTGTRQSGYRIEKK